MLSRSCRKEEQIEEKLEKFRNNIQLKKHSLGLMFACCERLKKKEVETAVFKKVFPGVPLIGLHGDGEFGLNTLNTSKLSPFIQFWYVIARKTSALNFRTRRYLGSCVYNDIFGLDISISLESSLAQENFRDTINVIQGKR